MTGTAGVELGEGDDPLDGVGEAVGEGDVPNVAVGLCEGVCERHRARDRDCETDVDADAEVVSDEATVTVGVVASLAETVGALDGAGDGEMDGEADAEGDAEDDAEAEAATDTEPLDESDGECDADVVRDPRAFGKMAAVGREERVVVVDGVMAAVSADDRDADADAAKSPLLVLWPPAQRQVRSGLEPFVMHSAESLLICVASESVDVFPLLSWSGLVDALDRFNLVAQVCVPCIRPHLNPLRSRCLLSPHLAPIGDSQILSMATPRRHSYPLSPVPTLP
jgi:hypothetical protein